MIPENLRAELVAAIEKRKPFTHSTVEESQEACTAINKEIVEIVGRIGDAGVDTQNVEAIAIAVIEASADYESSYNSAKREYASDEADCIARAVVRRRVDPRLGWLIRLAGHFENDLDYWAECILTGTYADAYGAGGNTPPPLPAPSFAALAAALASSPKEPTRTWAGDPIPDNSQPSPPKSGG